MRDEQTVRLFCSVDDINQGPFLRYHRASYDEITCTERACCYLQKPMKADDIALRSVTEDGRES